MAQAVISMIQRAGTDYGEGNIVAKNTFYLISEDSNNTAPISAPLIIPITGDYFSYEIYLQFRLDYKALVKVFNFKIWTDAELPEGYSLTVNNNPVEVYENPLNIESERGNRVSLLDYDSLVNSINIAGELIDIDDKTDYTVLQIKVEPGSLPLEKDINLFFSYDEI